MKSCITLFLLLFVFCSGAFAQLRGALGAPNVVLKSIDARTGQPFFESQLAPEWGSIKSVSIVSVWFEPSGHRKAPEKMMAFVDTKIVSTKVDRGHFATISTSER